tara:strand:- start:882 stop:1193 length:312 start_codon:yes stop_codon:yes gene_type:complete
MEIKNETLEKMYAISYKSIATKNDKMRALIKGDSHAQKIQEIRAMTKYQLSEFISDLQKQSHVKLALKIAHSNSSSKTYRMLASHIKNDIELINYARNRLYVT